MDNFSVNRGGRGNSTSGWTIGAPVNTAVGDLRCGGAQADEAPGSTAGRGNAKAFSRTGDGKGAAPRESAASVGSTRMSWERGAGLLNTSVAAFATGAGQACAGSKSPARRDAAER